MGLEEFISSIYLNKENFNIFIKYFYEIFYIYKENPHTLNLKIFLKNKKIFIFKLQGVSHKHNLYICRI